ncbi:alpha-amylase family glycosyl hydrolase [Caballeronia sp. GAFFF1]|uniref:alpha-amylase family glycosyl hydrolase n=1 Tax=Caballeronia sp. GAFFF1 TaxID=2921779 RepID=UPI0020279792|nr:alpha-amylase family glycosyl hydrolase [Caballeronia sp. GAFFF1]
MMQPRILLQAFYKRGKFIAVPSPSDPNDPHNSPWWWDHIAENAAELARAGVTAVWLPPVTKAEQGSREAALGYSVFDDYDIGSKHQMGTVHTRYGTREQLTRLAAVLRANGLDIVLDLQLNHRKGGTGVDGTTFEYRDALGANTGGRFAKNRTCFHSRYPANPIPADFHPEIAQDPAVPDGIGELQIGSKVFFGPDLAHVTARPEGYVSTGLIAAVDWLTRALDAQGYRLDHVQGVSAVFLRALLDNPNAAGKFAVGEYWDGDVGKINNWIVSEHWMGNRCSAFDFPLYFTLLAMSHDPNFDMASLDHAGLAGANPFHAVTFVENHDTESRRDLVPRNIQPDEKPLAYAFILTSEGLPCVFFKDFSTAPGCLGGLLRPILLNLMWIHQNIAEGPTEPRWKERDVFVFERTGGNRLLVGLNRNKVSARGVGGVATGFPPNQPLHDYTGHAPDLVTDAQGHVRLTIPANDRGLGYVCYSIPGLGQRDSPQGQDVQQVFEGSSDLDIPCAQAGKAIDVARIFCETGTAVKASLLFDSHEWAPGTVMTLTLTDPDGMKVTERTYSRTDAGATMDTTTRTRGFHNWSIRADAPRPDFMASFKLTTRYRAPTTL